MLEERRRKNKQQEMCVAEKKGKCEDILCDHVKTGEDGNWGSIDKKKG